MTLLILNLLLAVLCWQVGCNHFHGKGSRNLKVTGCMTPAALQISSALYDKIKPLRQNTKQRIEA